MALLPSGASEDQPLLFSISSRNFWMSLSPFISFALGASFFSFTLLANSLAWSLVLQITSAAYRVAPLLFPIKLTPSILIARPDTASNHW